MKIGDKVRCLRNFNDDCFDELLTIGKIYEVIDVSDESDDNLLIKIVMDNKKEEWFYPELDLLDFGVSKWFELYEEHLVRLCKEVDYFQITRECSLI